MASATGAQPLSITDTVTLVLADPEAHEVWEKALALMSSLKGHWTLVGGLMVQLHAQRAQRPGIRLTRDVDILADSRERPSGTEAIARQLEEMEFALSDTTGGLAGPLTGFRFTRGSEVVDVLGPDGTRKPPKTTGGHETIAVPGGSQALARTELIEVKLDDRVNQVRTPNLLAAILLKARALLKPQRDQDAEDLVTLLGCVGDPLTLRDGLEGRQRRWLLDASDRLDFDGAGLTERFSTAELSAARTVMRLLCQSHR